MLYEVITDEGLTRETLAEDIADFKKAGIDRSRHFELARDIKEAYIVDKVEYKDAILLVVEAVSYDGTFQRLPFPYVLERNNFV